MAPLTCKRPKRSTLAQDPAAVAKWLLGQTIVRVLNDGECLAGTIVETEAYLGVIDQAAHTFGGKRTKRNQSMYAKPGTAYVYFTYGMHHCLNVVCGQLNEPVAVLIRALEPTQGLDTMRKNRQANPARKTRRLLKDHQLCSGPGKLCQALAIDRQMDSIDLLTSDSLLLVQSLYETLPDNQIVNTPRIGVDSAGAWALRPLRWYISDNCHISIRNRHLGE